MSARATTTTPRIRLEPCAVDDARLDPMLQDYLREWSVLLPVPTSADGRFVYPGRAQVDASLLVDDDAGGRAVGFAFTSRDDAGAAHVEEFFVTPAARRRGVGVAAARALLAAAPGPWTWTVRPENPRALAFWRRAFPDAAESLERGDDGVVRTRFVTGAAVDTAGVLDDKSRRGDLP